MSDEPSPRPWRVNSVTGGHIIDANGGPVCFCVGSDCAERAALIVDAVNAIEATKKLSIQLYDPIRRAESERDRLRDIVRRLVDRFGDFRFDEEDITLLREARAAIGEDRK